MNIQNTRLTTLGVCILLALPAQAQKPVSKASPAKHTAAMTFAKAGETWGEIVADRKTLAEAIKTGQLSEAHDLAFSIRDGVVTLPYKSNGLAAAKKAALAKQVEIVAGIAENIDRYADAGNGAKTKTEYARLVKALSAIEALYPANALPASGEKPMSAADRALFLTPGGLYTQADIAANGNASAYQKYAGIVPSHNAKVSPGDPVCPISETKPNPQLTWIVNAKTYTFCCPPCIAEFVQKAKKTPQAIKEPSAYVKR